jgi:LiaI-LiaF-like transmembrane region
MDNHQRHGGVAGPLILVAIGLALLLSNMGIITWSAWDLLQLWPLILMAVGIDLLIGRRSTGGSVLAAILIIALLAGGLWLASSDYRVPGEPTGQSFGQPLQGMARAEIALRPAVGDVRVSSLDPGSQDLLTGQVHAYQQGMVTRHFSMNGDTGTLELDTQGAGIIYPSFGPGPVWDLQVNPGLPVLLIVEQGAGEMSLDLHLLQVSDLQVNLGLGQVAVILPAKGQYQAEISGAIGETRVTLPEGLEARITINAALAGRFVPSNFSQEGNVYQSSGYDGAADRVDLTLGEAIGSVRVDR